MREATRLRQQSQEQVADEPDQSVEGSQTSLNDPMASVPPESELQLQTIKRSLCYVFMALL